MDSRFLSLVCNISEFREECGKWFARGNLGMPGRKGSCPGLALGKDPSLRPPPPNQGSSGSRVLGPALSPPTNDSIGQYAGLMEGSWFQIYICCYIAFDLV